MQCNLCQQPKFSFSRGLKKRTAILYYMNHSRRPLTAALNTSAALGRLYLSIMRYSRLHLVCMINVTRWGRWEREREREKRGVELTKHRSISLQKFIETLEDKCIVPRVPGPGAQHHSPLSSAHVSDTIAIYCQLLRAHHPTYSIYLMCVAPPFSVPAPWGWCTGLQYIYIRMGRRIFFVVIQSLTM